LIVKIPSNKDRFRVCKNMLKIVVNKAATLQGHKDSVYSLEEDPDKKHIYSSGADGMVVK